VVVVVGVAFGVVLVAVEVGGFGLTEAAGEAATVTPTPSSPFIPAAACPMTEHRYSYFPTFVNVTVSVAACPDLSIAVALPTQAFFAELAVGVVQILKS
jgi:hypothetical protein